MQDQSVQFLMDELELPHDRANLFEVRLEFSCVAARCVCSSIPEGIKLVDCTFSNFSGEFWGRSVGVEAWGSDGKVEMRCTSLD